MTRILSLGQNNGLTVMILNLAPSRSFHLDTISSLNFANRTKKIEVNEVENEPIFRGHSTASKAAVSVTGPSIQRQPLRAISVAAHNANIGANDKSGKAEKPIKAFSVYADKRRSQDNKIQSSGTLRNPVSAKRALDSFAPASRPPKVMRPSEALARSGRSNNSQAMSKELIEDLISRRIDEKLAEKALESQAQPAVALPGDLQKRLDALEQRVAEKEDGERTEGLHFLLMAKQHAARGEDASALRMYELAQPHFKENSKLEAKIDGLRDKIRAKKEVSFATQPLDAYTERHASVVVKKKKPTFEAPEDSDYEDNDRGVNASDDEDDYKPKTKLASKPKTTLRRPALPSFALIPSRPEPHTSTEPHLSDPVDPSATTPRTSHLLSVINTRDISRIKSLKGVGAKRAESIVSALCDLEAADITDLAQLGALRGVGLKTVENMRSGIGVL